MTLLDNALAVGSVEVRDLCLDMTEEIITCHKAANQGCPNLSIEKYIFISKAFIHACSNDRNVDILPKLINFGANKDFCGAFICLSNEGNFPLCDLEKYKQSNDHFCALESAAMASAEEITQYLLKIKAKIPHNHWRGWDFLWCAAETGFRKICSPKLIFCLDKKYDKQDSNTPQQSIEIPKPFLAHKRNDEGVSKFADVCSYLDSTSGNKAKLFYQLVPLLGCSPELLDTFKNFGLDFGSVPDIFSIVMKGTHKSSERALIVKELLDSGRFSHSHLDVNGRTPVMIEVLLDNCNFEIICKLLEGDVDISLKDASGSTFVHYLMETSFGDGKVVELLKDLHSKGNSIDLLDNNRLGKNVISMALMKLDCGVGQNERKETFDFLLRSSWFKSTGCDKVFHPYHIVIKSDDVDSEMKVKLFDALTSHRDKFSLDSSDDNDTTPLCLAFKHLSFEDMELIKLLVWETRNVNAQDKNGYTALHCLVSRHRRGQFVKEILRLLSRGENKKEMFNCNLKDEEGLTPLMRYMQQSGKDEEIVKLLLDLGSDVHVKNYLHKDVIHDAFCTNFNVLDEEVLTDEKYLESELGEEPLVEKEIFLLEPSESIEDVVESDHINRIDVRMNIMKLLFEEASAWQNTDFLGRNYLHYCVLSPFDDSKTELLCKVLIEKGADVSDRNNLDGTSALVLALKFSNRKPTTAKLMVQKCKGLGYAEVENIVIWLAKRRSLSASLLDLLKENNMLSKDIKGKDNIFHKLAGIGFISESEAVDKRIFDLITGCGISINHMNSSGYTPLHIACKKKTYPKCIKNFLVFQADANIPAKNGDTCLHLLVKSDRGDADLKKVLNLFTVDEKTLSVQNKQDKTPLTEAVKRCNRIETMKYFLQNGSDVNFQDNEDKTCIHHILCREENDVDAHRALMVCFSSEPVMDLTDNYEENFLNCASSVGYFSRILCITSILGRTNIESIRDTCADKSQRNPLHNATISLKQHNPIVNLELYVRVALLLVHGISYKSKDKDGKLPLDVLEEPRGHILEKLVSSKNSQDEIIDCLEKELVAVEGVYSYQTALLPDVAVDYPGKILTERFQKFLSKVVAVLATLDFRATDDYLKSQALNDYPEGSQSATDTERSGLYDTEQPAPTSDSTTSTSVQRDDTQRLKAQKLIHRIPAD